MCRCVQINAQQTILNHLRMLNLRRAKILEDVARTQTHLHSGLPHVTMKHIQHRLNDNYKAYETENPPEDWEDRQYKRISNIIDKHQEIKKRLRRNYKDV